MNKRIAELKDRAWATCDEPEQYMDKFAELLVRECMDVIKQNENASLTASNFTYEKKQGMQLGLEFAITDIADHFGIDE